MLKYLLPEFLKITYKISRSFCSEAASSHITLRPARYYSLVCSPIDFMDASGGIESILSGSFSSKIR
jgi:hypothetical protein